MTDYPYAGRFEVHRRLPEEGRPPVEILAELREMAAGEDALWETGKASGTIYCGDHDHYAFMTETYGLFGHANALQRDMFPSATKFEGEILAMTFDLMHAGAVTGTTPGGVVTTGGTGSILHAMLAYRDAAARHRGVTRPNIVKPETAHPAFDKAGHLFGIEVRRAPADPRTTLVDAGAVAGLIDADTIAVIGSAGNYGYGTIDPIAELSELALARGVGLHVDACLGGFILPFGEELGLDVPVFDFRLPGVTSISADTHKYGYGLKGTSTLLFRDSGLRNELYFLNAGWSGGKYLSPGIEGSRSGGLLAATWAGMVKLGRSGYRRHAERIFATARQMIDAVRSHPELRVLGDPTFLFSFTSDEFDIYHVYDFMAGRGWRLNGQQYPNAVHMAVTRPQTRPGVAETFAADLAAAVRYAAEREAAGEKPMSGAVYGGVPGGLTEEADDFIRQIMAGMLDTQQSLPPAAR
ncbi:pyridoxal phosphate-dependent decarboxylase family protein [Actinomadura formosensis]|uniref:pyridoxal phosphate-dependent decarboxylase family protein n=1 Tax=Actinomadura formosensis TaxID=60706 RepID=UPI000836CF77|nr:pyridoxal-dependent decarboxylase [Actinomadura formosensis]